MVTYSTDDTIITSGWEVVSTLPSGAIRSMIETSDGALLLAGGDGEIITSDDLGETWNVVDTTPTDECRSLYEDEDGIIWGGDNGNILKSTDRGYSFSVDSTTPSGYVNDFITETATDDFRAADNGQILSKTFTDRLTLGRSKTAYNEVMIGNHHKTANFTDIKVDDGGSFSDIFPVSSFPQNLLPATFAVDDALYLGIDTSQTDSGPFFSAIFDIATPMSSTTSYTLVWEYYNTSAAWVTLTCQDGTSQLSETGVKGVFWKAPSNWATVAVDGVTGYWIRGRVSALTGTPTTPTQQNRDIYSVAWSFLEVPRDQITGDMNSLIKLFLDNRSDTGGPGGSEPQLYSNRIIVGVKPLTDHTNFRASLNFADEQNPAGITIDTSVDPDSATSIEADSNLSSATGRRVLFDASVAESGNGLDNWEDRVAVEFGPTIARDFYGTYKAFLRCKQQGGSAGEVNLRIKAIGGTGGVSSVTDQKETQSTTDHELIEFDTPITLPVSSQMTPAELGDETSLIVQINVEANDADLYLYDLVLIPTDVVWVDAVDKANTAESSVENGRRLLIDSVTIPKFPTRAIVQKLASNSNAAMWLPDGDGKFSLPTTEDLRLWFLSARTNGAGSSLWLSEPEVVHSGKISKVDRYLLGRGDG